MLVERLLAGERVTHESRHNTIREVRINVQPVQQPVPVYVAILRREAPITWVARGAACCSCPTRRWTASRKSA